MMHYRRLVHFITYATVSSDLMKFVENIGVCQL